MAKITGSEIYSPENLATYDHEVLEMSNKHLWKIPTEILVDFFQKNVTANHLDAGVGTGYFLKKTKFPTDNPRIALMDLSPAALQAASSRIQWLSPEVYQQNILQPEPLQIQPFDSISLNYVLHCLPGTMKEKERVFTYLKTLLKQNAKIFGSTLIHHKNQSIPARHLMIGYQTKGIFNNAHDTREGLEEILNQNFRESSTAQIGDAILFSAIT